MIEITGYKVIKKIGQGGMATVYLAKHKLLDREVAIKLLLVGTLSDITFRKSFIKEGQIVAKFDHPYIVKIYDIGIENDQFYMAMELVKNGTLKEKLIKSKLPLEDTIKVIMEMASALEYAHGKGFIHRDIKPANILFRNNGDAVLTDFGIAKMQGTTSDMTQMGYMAGTPHYMAPEQATGGDLDQRTDVYSLGIVFYEMLTGNKPFEAANTVALTYEHVHADVPILGGKHAFLQPVLNKVLAKKPDDRYVSATAFADAIVNITTSESDTVITPLPKIRQEVTTKTPWLWIGVASLFVGTAFAGYIIKNKSELYLAKAEQSEIKGYWYDYSNWSDNCVAQLKYSHLGGSIYLPTDSSQYYYNKASKFFFKDVFIKQKINEINKKVDNYKSLACFNEKKNKQERLESKVQEYEFDKLLDSESGGVIELE